MTSAATNPLTPLPIPGRELRLSPSGNLLAVRDKYITFLNLETGNRLAGLGVTRIPQTSRSPSSPNNRALALAEGVAVALWDLEKGVSEGRLEGHGEPVEGLAFTREGNRIVSASGDVWDLATGELTAVFDSATDQIALSPNGQLIIGSDGSVWDLATGELIGKIPFEKGRQEPSCSLPTAGSSFVPSKSRSGFGSPIRTRQAARLRGRPRRRLRGRRSAISTSIDWCGENLWITTGTAGSTSDPTAGRPPPGMAEQFGCLTCRTRPRWPSSLSKGRSPMPPSWATTSWWWS